MITNSELIKSIKKHIEHHKIGDVQSGKHRLLLEALNKSIELLEKDTPKIAEISVYDDVQLMCCPNCGGILFGESHCPNCGQRISYNEGESI